MQKRQALSQAEVMSNRVNPKNTPEAVRKSTNTLIGRYNRL
ncbi:hypothetical protein KL86DPRO_40118 [uncultured delta proteobacterium]|uniref:Uncharacterized protein n=1 Tax=uncultured delta proteobacterium TaxID=34034 RepID=A0A212K9Z2_9DELT|nr:hypothetical protein KL86DPRO_40118 [uncultured delta proteobacterium]